MTSDKRNWLLRGFMRQWNKYAPEIPVLIAGFTRPDFPLLDGFTFHSIGLFEDYPADKWTNALAKLFLKDYPTLSHAAILLEDYWVSRPVDVEALEMASLYMLAYRDALRFDLCTDRLNAKHKPIGSWGRLDLIESTGDMYDLSLQASMWNIELLLTLTRANESPWQLELEGTGRLINEYKSSGMRVVGTRQNPINYLIAVRNGHFSFDGSWMFPPKELSVEDRKELEDLGYDHDS